MICTQLINRKMKKSHSILIKKLMCPFFFLTFFFSVNAQEKAVYLRSDGMGDGTSDTSPLGDIYTAYQKLGDTGGTIVICGKYGIASTFTEPAHAGEITITQKYDGVDYRNDNINSFYIINAGRRFVLSGPTKFENINFRGDANIKYAYLLFIAGYHPITMGEGIATYEFRNTDIAQSIIILGGYQEGQGTPVSSDLDSHINIKSGKFILVGFNRYLSTNNEAYTGTAHINISGGEILKIYGGSVSGIGGNLDLNISGGVFWGDIYASRNGANSASGVAYVKITGGDFTNCNAIIGDIDDGATIDISKHPDNESLLKKLQSFDKVISVNGESSLLIPNEVFDYRSFTDKTGLIIPYRIWFPRNYDPSKKYPLALYMHGNGSRGSDNVSQLTTIGAALVPPILNSRYDCIIFAPQCNTGTSWVTTYPGNAGYSVETVPMGRYLTAAKELLDTIIDNNSVDKSRIYIFGSSNGGGASWDLMCRFPDLFAAAIPMAGCGESSNAAAIADSLKNIPIWTFHGNADTSLSVEGTRGIVNAIKAAGGTKIIYTEIEGGTHNICHIAAATAGIVDWLFSKKSDVDLSYTSTIGGNNFVVENPVGDKLRIKIPESAEIELFTLAGVKILTKKLYSGDNVISINLKKGIYLVRTEISNRPFSQKFIKL